MVGPPIPGAKDALIKFRLQGYKIIIFTCRGETYQIAEYLDKHKIPFDEINRNSNNSPFSNMGKPTADYYIDDRGIEFRRNWEEITNRILKGK